MENTNRFTIGKKMYLFVIAIVLFATGCVCALNYVINVDQINTYYKRLTINNAVNYSTLVDVEFLKELRKLKKMMMNPSLWIIFKKRVSMISSSKNVRR